jgi:hypothetical protein
MIETWLDKPMDEVLERSRDLLEDTNFPAVRIWRE